jgi:hypothetical protein
MGFCKLSSGLTGGKLYGLLPLACAAKSDVERTYPFTLANLMALPPAEILRRICAP